MANMTCYVRFYGFLQGGTPNWNKLGHVDLQINGVGGADFTLSNPSISVNNPVFSYSGVNNGKGYVRIFPDSKTMQNFNEPHLLCKWKFTITTTQANSFRSMLQSTLLHKASYAAYHLYEFPVGHPYAIYTNARYNSFCATADWCAQYFGRSIFKIYYQQHHYSDYAFWNLLPEKYEQYIYYLNY